jgi:type II secretory pathway pseudopilin PulG
MRTFAKTRRTRACRAARCPSGRERTGLGFALLELLVVVVILIVLTTLFWGGIGGGNVKNAKAKACSDNLQKIYLAMQIYARDNGSLYPNVAGAATSETPLAALVPRYTADTSVFICPLTSNSTLTPGKPLTSGKISYAYWMGLHQTDPPAPLMADALLNTLPKGPGQLAFSSTGEPPGNNHGKEGGNILMSDGSVSASGVTASIPMIQTVGVTLLNPKP